MPRARALQREKPLQWGARALPRRKAPTHHNWRKPACSNEDPTQPKINKIKNKKLTVLRLARETNWKDCCWTKRSTFALESHSKHNVQNSSLGFGRIDRLHYASVKLLICYRLKQTLRAIILSLFSRRWDYDVSSIKFQGPNDSSSQTRQWSK